MHRKKVLAGAAAVAILTLGAGGVAYADDGQITGSDANEAKEAALAHTGGGRVTDSEVGDEEGYYEVEVTRDDGTETDVHLDRDFNVVSDQTDDQGSDDGDDPEDDDGPNDDDGANDDNGSDD